MQLVVFAVVLILPSFLSGESYVSITQITNECEGLLLEGGHRECDNQGSNYVGYNPKECTVVCDNNAQPKLPKGVCSDGSVDCNSEDVKKKLRDWAYM
uniref:Putative ixodes 10 kDa peptide protein n=1 Tax=Ixodes ricinus TaxID=34613 RepID=A0A0K8RDM3_IXORI